METQSLVGKKLLRAGVNSGTKSDTENIKSAEESGQQDKGRKDMACDQRSLEHTQEPRLLHVQSTVVR